MGEEATKFMFFSSYYDAAKLLPESEQGPFLMGLFAYAFDGVEPEFDGAAAIAFVLVRPNIDASMKRSKTNAENAKAERKATAKANGKATAKATAKADGKTIALATPSLEKEKEKEKEKDREGNFSQEKNFPPSVTAVGASAAKAAPPRCPLCDSRLVRNTQTGRWDCPGCMESYDRDRFAA